MLNLSNQTNRHFLCFFFLFISVFIVSNQDEHRRFVMINKVSIMTMEETCKVNNNNFMPMFFRYEIIWNSCEVFYDT